MTALDLNAAAPAIGGVFALGAVGYLAVRARILTRVGVAELTRLLVAFILPAFLFESVYNEYTHDKLPYLAVIGGLEAAAVLLGAGLAWALSAVARVRSHRGTIMALCAFQNNAYLPVPLVMAVPGAARRRARALHDRTSCCSSIPCCGRWAPTCWARRCPAGSASPRSSSRGERAISRGAGGAGAEGVLPADGRHHAVAVLTFVKTLGAATVPLAMVVLGAILAEAHWSRDFEPPRDHSGDVGEDGAAAADRPRVAAHRAKPGPDPKLVVLGGVRLAPATNIMLVCKRYGGNTSLVAVVLFVTYLASILTMPLWLRML